MFQINKFKGLHIFLDAQTLIEINKKFECKNQIARRVEFNAEITLIERFQQGKR